MQYELISFQHTHLALTHTLESLDSRFHRPMVVLASHLSQFGASRQATVQAHSNELLGGIKVSSCCVNTFKYLPLQTFSKGMSRNRSFARPGREPSVAYSSSHIHQAPSTSRGAGGLRPRFEELGFNYGFARADPEKNAGYCFVYRTLKNKLEKMGMACRIRGDENEIRLTELEGPLEKREKVKIFTHDIISYYKFNHRAKFVAICIDAYHRRKTGYWFLCFEREGQLSAFCEYLNWLFGLDVLDSYEGREEDRVSYVDRRSGSAQSFLLNHMNKRSDIDRRYSRGRYEPDSYDSGYTESSSEAYPSSGFSPPPPPPKMPHAKYSPSKSTTKRNFKRWWL